MRLLWDGDIEQ